MGADVWMCRESTALLNNGSPFAGTLKFKYDAKSEFMVESKSMKLFLNSFDMCKMGDTVLQAVSNYEFEVRRALENILQTRVDVRFFHSKSSTRAPFWDSIEFEEVSNEMLSSINITDYTAQTNHIEYRVSPHRNIGFTTNTLRSRCRHTKQKDTGTAYIYVTSNSIDQLLPTKWSMFKQIVSLREVNEFHEFCAEKLLTSFNRSKVGDVFVGLLYARRGSLDINPIRSTSEELLLSIGQNILDISVLPEKTFGQ